MDAHLFAPEPFGLEVAAETAKDAPWLIPESK